LAAQPADNANGHIGHREAADIIARQPQEATAWGNKFMREMNLMPSVSLSTNPNQVRADFQAERGHEVYSATKSSLEAVRQQGAEQLPSEASIKQKGEDFVREEGASFINTNSEYIDVASNKVSGQGAKVQKKVKDQQGRYVTGRVLEKVGQEINSTLKDIGNLNGEPQQK
jgi:hypothetical protein